MLVLITYDVATTTPEGRRRLRNVAKACTNKGQRVQNSVFECSVDNAQWIELRAKLTSMIDPEHDSLRFYLLGKEWKHRVEHIGAKPSYDPEAPLIV